MKKLLETEEPIESNFESEEFYEDDNEDDLESSNNLKKPLVVKEENRNKKAIYIGVGITTLILCIIAVVLIQKVTNKTPTVNTVSKTNPSDTNKIPVSEVKPDTSTVVTDAVETPTVVDKNPTTSSNNDDVLSTGVNKPVKPTKSNPVTVPTTRINDSYIMSLENIKEPLDFKIIKIVYKSDSALYEKYSLTMDKGIYKFYLKLNYKDLITYCDCPAEYWLSLDSKGIVDVNLTLLELADGASIIGNMDVVDPNKKAR